MALKPLVVRITGDTTGLEKSLDRAKRNIKGLAVAVAAGSVAVVGALGAMTAQGVALAREIEILSQRAGASPRELQRMAAGARTVGIDLQGMSDILQDVNDRVGDFLSTGGGPMADFFETIAPRVGVTAKQFQNLSGPQALQLYVDTLKAAGANQQQMTFYMEAMSSEATRLLPLLENGGAAMLRFANAAEDAGQIIDDGMIAQIGRAQTAIQTLSGVVDALRLRLAAEVAPALEVAAQRLQQLAQSDATQAAITRLVEAFGRLADVILTQDFIGAAVSGLEMLMGVAEGVANGMVWLSQNVEVVTVAFSGLAIAVAALGGPLTIVAGLLAVALGGIAMWRGQAEDSAIGSDAAAEAVNRLNAALGVFYQTGAPSAGTAAIDLARDNYKLAASALAAAEAEIAKMKAAEKGMRAMVESRGGVISMEAEAMLSAKEASLVRQRMAAERAIEEARIMMDRTARSVTGSSYDAVSIPPVELPEIPGMDLPGPDAIPGLGVGGAVADQLEQRLDALTTGLATEREVLAEWYAEGKDVLREALEAEKITEEEYRHLRERLEQEHRDRLKAIQDTSAAAAFDTIVGTGKEILSAIGQTNDKAAKAAKALGAFEALVNAYRAASQALADPKLPWFAKVSAAGSVLAAGIGFANSIKGMSPSGGGSSGGGGGASSAAAAPARAPSATYYFDLTGNGGVVSNQTFMETITSTLQDQIDNGGRVVFNGA